MTGPHGQADQRCRAWCFTIDNVVFWAFGPLPPPQALCHACVTESTGSSISRNSSPSGEISFITAEFRLSATGSSLMYFQMRANTQLKSGRRCLLHFRDIETTFWEIIEQVCPRKSPSLSSPSLLLFLFWKCVIYFNFPHRHGYRASIGASTETRRVT